MRQTEKPHARHRRDHSLIGGNPKVVRKINRAAILNIIRERQPISRIKIAQTTRLNKSTVSHIVASLLDEDLLWEDQDKPQRVGRNPRNLRLMLGKHFVGAINIDSSKTRIAIADIDGSMKESSELETRTTNPKEFLAQTIAELRVLQAKANASSLEGIGITIAGIVDPLHGRVVYAPRLKWEDYDIGKAMQELCPDTVTFIENDAKASALAELWFGTQPFSLSNFVFLSVGPGIGTGIVVERRLMNGEFCAAGEFGHIILFEGGEACSCGNNGCWEAYASDHATVKRFSALDGAARVEDESVMLQDIVDLAAKSGSNAREVIRQTGHYLGMGIVNILKTIDPEVIVIGGRIVQSWDIIHPEIMKVVGERAFLGGRRNITIVPTSLSVRPRLLGAATLPIKEIFSGFRITL